MIQSSVLAHQRDTRRQTEQSQGLRCREKSSMEVAPALVPRDQIHHRDVHQLDPLRRDKRPFEALNREVAGLNRDIAGINRDAIRDFAGINRDTNREVAGFNRDTNRDVASKTRDAAPTNRDAPATYRDTLNKHESSKKRSGPDITSVPVDQQRPYKVAKSCVSLHANVVFHDDDDQEIPNATFPEMSPYVGATNPLRPASGVSISTTASNVSPIHNRSFVPASPVAIGCSSRDQSHTNLDDMRSTHHLDAMDTDDAHVPTPVVHKPSPINPLLSIISEIGHAPSSLDAGTMMVDVGPLSIPVPMGEFGLSGALTGGSSKSRQDDSLTLPPHAPETTNPTDLMINFLSPEMTVGKKEDIVHTSPMQEKTMATRFDHHHGGTDPTAGPVARRAGLSDPTASVPNGLKIALSSIRAFEEDSGNAAATQTSNHTSPISRSLLSEIAFNDLSHTTDDTAHERSMLRTIDGHIIPTAMDPHPREEMFPGGDRSPTRTYMMSNSPTDSYSPKRLWNHQRSKGSSSLVHSTMYQWPVMPIGNVDGDLEAAQTMSVDGSQSVSGLVMMDPCTTGPQAPDDDASSVVSSRVLHLTTTPPVKRLNRHSSTQTLSGLLKKPSHEDVAAASTTGDTVVAASEGTGCGGQTGEREQVHAFVQSPRPPVVPEDPTMLPDVVKNGIRRPRQGEDFQVSLPDVHPKPEPFKPGDTRKGSLGAWANALGRGPSPLLEDESTCGESMLKHLPPLEKRAFTKGIRDYMKDFHQMALHVPELGTFTTSQLVYYYYTTFKRTPEYAQWKKWSRDQFHGGGGGGQQTDAATSTTPAPMEEVHAEKGGSSPRPKSANPSSSAGEKVQPDDDGSGTDMDLNYYESLSDMINAKVLKPGVNALRIRYMGQDNGLDLLQNGDVQFEGDTYPTLGAFCLAFKHKFHPTKRSNDNPWRTVFYQNIPLSVLRNKKNIPHTDTLDASGPAQRPPIVSTILKRNLSISSLMEAKLIVTGKNRFVFRQTSDKFHVADLREDGKLADAKSNCVADEPSTWVEKHVACQDKGRAWTLVYYVPPDGKRAQSLAAIGKQLIESQGSSSAPCEAKRSSTC